VAHDLCNTAMHPFKVKLTHSLFNLQLFYRPRSFRKGEFYSELLCVLIDRPSCLPIFFSPMPPMSSSCFGIISDEGGGAIVTIFARGAGRYKFNSSPETVVEVASNLHRNVPYFYDTFWVIHSLRVGWRNHVSEIDSKVIFMGHEIMKLL